MTIHLAADHAGYEHKEAVGEWLRSESCTVVDHGAFSFDALDDYPDFIGPAAAAVGADPTKTYGIIFGGSGQGEAMLANRYAGVRAAVFYGGVEEIPVLSRAHNNANMLSIGARFVPLDICKRVIWEWLHAAPLTDEKYHRRNKKIETITKHLHS